MDRIKQLYGTFNKAEIRTLKNLLSHTTKKGENKPLELLQMLEEDMGITADEASRRLYNDAKSKAFMMMKSRLFHRMTELLGVMNDFEVKDTSDAYFKVHLDYRKAMMMATVLRARRLSGLAIPILEDAVALARKAVNPEWELDALNQIRSINSGTQEQIDTLVVEIGRTLQETERDVNASAIYLRLMRRLKGIQTHEVPELITRFEQQLAELDVALQHCYSVRADYFRHKLRYKLYKIKGQIEPCRKALQKAIDILEQHEGLRNNERLAAPYSELGEVEMRLLNFDAGLKAYAIAETHVEPGSLHHLLVLTPVLYGLVVTRRLEEADVIYAKIDAMLPQVRMHISVSVSNEVAFLKSTLFYAHGRLNEAWRILQGEHDFSSDKSGLAVVVRIFEIMLLIDRNMTDVASQKLENLRKHLGRYSADHRIKAVYKLLAAQEKFDFQFQHFKNEETILKSMTKDFMNSQSGFEAVHFEDWYQRQFEIRR
jgi:tetratricopeptide (TPR) repeat protein